MFSTLKVKKPVSLITGSGTGIGAITAQRLAEKGHSLVLHYNKSALKAKTVARQCEEMGAKVFLCQADLTEQEQCRRLVEEALGHFGGIDHLVNNAGATIFSDYGKYKTLAFEDYERLMRINLYAPYFLSTLIAPHMQKAGNGVITNISSMSGITGQGSSIPYAVSKGALNTQTLAFAKAFAPEIRVNAICPGVVASSWWEKRFKDEGQLLLFQKKQEEGSCINRVLTPEDIAKTILYLWENDHITGQVMQLTAGTHLGPVANKEKVKPEAVSESLSSVSKPKVPS